MFPEGRILDFAIVGAIALIVVGPKDLPMLMRKIGAFVARMRGMAAEFRSSFDEMARQSELDELRREVKAIRSGASLKAAVGLGEDKETRQVFDEIHADLHGDGTPSHPAADYEYPASFDAAPEASPSPVAPPEAPVDTPVTPT